MLPEALRGIDLSIPSAFGRGEEDGDVKHGLCCGNMG